MSPLTKYTTAPTYQIHRYITSPLTTWPPPPFPHTSQNNMADTQHYNIAASPHATFTNLHGFTIQHGRYSNLHGIAARTYFTIQHGRHTKNQSTRLTTWPSRDTLHSKLTIYTVSQLTHTSQFNKADITKY
jgi:hypothetical protein